MGEDNKACISLAKNPTNHSRCKHIDITFHFLRQLIQEKVLEVYHVTSKENVADILTKPLPRPQHRELAEKLMGQEIPKYEHKRE